MAIPTPGLRARDGDPDGHRAGRGHPTVQEAAIAGPAAQHAGGWFAGAAAAASASLRAASSLRLVRKAGRALRRRQAVLLTRDRCRVLGGGGWSAISPAGVTAECVQPSRAHRQIGTKAPRDTRSCIRARPPPHHPSPPPQHGLTCRSAVSGTAFSSACISFTAAALQHGRQPNIHLKPSPWLEVRSLCGRGAAGKMGEPWVLRGPDRAGRASMPMCNLDPSHARCAPGGAAPAGRKPLCPPRRAPCRCGRCAGWLAQGRGSALPSQR